MKTIQALDDHYHPVDENVPFSNKKELDSKPVRFNFLRENFLTLTIIVMLVGLVLVRFNPLEHSPNRDSGSFLYAGNQILQGDLPYIDFWDSKGPGIFYINALGLWLGKNTRWGVWLLEFCFLTFSSFFIYNGITRKWGRGAALFANVVWLYGFLRISQGGNFTEEYPLLFNFWVLAYFLRIDGLPSKKLLFLVGFTFSLSFLFRANNTGVQISILIALFLAAISKSQILQFIKKTIWLSLGALLPLGSVGLYFLSNDSFQQMVNAAITYNFYYSSHSFNNMGWEKGFQNIGWPAYVALSGYLAILFQTLRIDHKKTLSSIHLFLLINLPIEIILSSLSGRGYPHYFISWMPALAALSAFAYAHFSPQILSTKLKTTLDNPYGAMKLVIPILLVIYWSTGVFTDYKNIGVHLLFERENGIEKIDPVANYIRKNTNKNETVLVWGAYPGINFLAHRSSPTAYIFYPLYVESPFTERMGLAFYTEITTNKPKYIIDTSSKSNATILSLDLRLRQSQLQKKNNLFYTPPYQNDVFHFVDSNYQNINSINGFDIYLLSSP